MGRHPSPSAAGSRGSQALSWGGPPAGPPLHLLRLAAASPLGCGAAFLISSTLGLVICAASGPPRKGEWLEEESVLGQQVWGGI